MFFQCYDVVLQTVLRSPFWRDLGALAAMVKMELGVGRESL